MKKFVCLLLTLALCCGLTAAWAEGQVSTDGSTSMEKVIGALGEYYMEANPGVSFTYNPTGSGAGIMAAAEGRCDIGLSSRALKEEEKASGLVETVLAYDGIALIVHPENPVADLTVEQIARIYTGEITNWSELGGADAQIVVIGREGNRRARRGRAGGAAPAARPRRGFAPPRRYRRGKAPAPGRGKRPGERAAPAYRPRKSDS